MGGVGWGGVPKGLGNTIMRRAGIRKAAMSTSNLGIASLSLAMRAATTAGESFTS